MQKTIHTISTVILALCALNSTIGQPPITNVIIINTQYMQGSLYIQDNNRLWYNDGISKGS